MSINANLSQNSNTKSVNLTLPTFQGNMDRIFPFEPKDKPKKGLIQNINFQYSTRAENRIQQQRTTCLLVKCLKTQDLEFNTQFH